MACASRLYPRAKPRGFTLHWIKKPLYKQGLLKIKLKFSSSLYQRFCLLESKARKKWESTAFPFFKARNATLVLFFVYDFVCLNPRHHRT